MEEYQTRVIEEKDELDNKRARLDAFIDGETYPDLKTRDQDLLVKQANVMGQYSKVLQKRIERFKE